MKLKKKSSEVAHTGLDCFCGRFGNKAAPEDCVDFWSFFFWRKKMTRCSRVIKQIDFCNTQAISAFKAGKIFEAEIWHDMAERKQAELDGMTLSECRQGAWA